jgi:hypothetical protein
MGLGDFTEQRIWSNGVTRMRIWECGMWIVDFSLNFLLWDLFFQSEIRNPKSEIFLTPTL